MKVLITGANGFVGKNLVSHLNLKKDIEIFKYDLDSTEEDLNKVEEPVVDADTLKNIKTDELTGDMVFSSNPNVVE